MENNHKKALFTTGLVVGALSGAAVALLFAPKSGKETREIVKTRAGEVWQKVKKNRSNSNNGVVEREASYLGASD
jgi:gas vesicle protein